jgi:hypothetical protein
MAEEGGAGPAKLVVLNAANDKKLSIDDLLHVGHHIPSFRRDLRTTTTHGEKKNEIIFIGFLDQLEFSIAYARTENSGNISDAYSMAVQLGEKQLGYAESQGEPSSVVDEFNRINRLYGRRVAASRRMSQDEAIAYAKTLVGL